MRRAFRILLALAAIMEARERPLLTGTVLDTSSAAVPGASLAAMDENTGLRFGATSGSDGVYALTLPAGSYKVTVRRPGFCTVAKLNIQVAAGTPSRADFVLPVGNFRETITITSGTESTNTSDASVSGLAGRRWIETLPLNGRGILSLIDLAPGVLATPASGGEAGQFTVNGQRPNTNYFTVDGVSGNNTVTGGISAAQFAGGTLPGMTAFGSTQNLVSLEALEEVRIQTSTFAPEYGRMPGAHVSLTTRSGTDQWHGSLFYSFRHEKLAANDWIANSLGLGRAPSRLNHGGGSLGGPLRRGRAYFFASTEALGLVQSATWSMITPSAAARHSAPERLQPLLHAFPAPTGPDTPEGVAEAAARAVRPASMRAMSVRADHALTSKLSLFAVYHQAPSAADFGFLQVDHSEFNSRRLTVSGVGVLGGMVNELRFGWSRAAVWTRSDLGSAGGAVPIDLRQYLPDTAGADAALYAVSIGGVGQLLSGDAGRNRQGQLSLGDTISARRGTHSMRAGIEYFRLTPERLRASARVTTSYGDLTGLLSGEAPVVSRTLAEPAVSHIESLSVFFQDTWRPHARLAINYGTRWELTPPPTYTATAGTDSFTLPATEPAPPGLGLGKDIVDGGTNVPGSGTSPAATPPGSPFTLWRTRYSQFAPRIGGAYSINSKSVLRVGWGVFFDTAFSAALDPINGYAFNRRQVATGGGPQLAFVAVAGYLSSPSLALPRSRQWNVAWENDFGTGGVLTASYVGSSGRRLLRREGSLLVRGTEEIFRTIQVMGSATATNNGQSNYHGMQFHYRRQWQSGFRANATYSFSRSMDNGSWDSALFLVSPERGITADSDRGPSSFDIGHSLTGAVSYPLPGSVLRGWSVDSMVRVRSGFPIDVRSAENLLGLGFDNLTRPDRVAGQPLWIFDSRVPGGRRLNPAAFLLPSGMMQGNLGRNAIRGFGMGQLDMSVRRTFVLGESAGVEFRVEVFNVTNGASPGDPVPYLQDARFGRSISMLNLMMGSGAPHSGLTPAFQAGGPRTAQIQLRFRF